MKCEHGNDITVLIEWFSDYNEDGFQTYDAEGDPSRTDHFKTEGCPQCALIKIKHGYPPKK